MKRSKLWMSLLVVVLILSFAITTVVAQAEVPPVGELDDDGDLIIGVFPAVDASGEGGLSDLEGLVDFAEINTAAEGITVDATPIHPVFEYVYTKYPTFVFSEDFGALKYKVMVTSTLPEPDEVVYTFKGNPYCNLFDECELTPTTALKPAVYGKNQGIYFWQVKTKFATGWEEDWSTKAGFIVLKNGFDSTFTTLDTKWLPMYGTWTVTSTGLAKTKGEPFAFSSLMEKHYASNDYVYEVMMKRKTVDDPGDVGSANRIYFNAIVQKNNSFSLYDGYAFAYANNGKFSLYRTDDGFSTPLFGWADFAAIIPNDWNKLTVLVRYPFIDLWINETYIGFNYIGDDLPYYMSGYVGIDMYEFSAEKSPLLVDYAWLEYTTAAPYPWPWGSLDYLRDPAYELKPSADAAGGSEFASP